MGRGHAAHSRGVITVNRDAIEISYSYCAALGFSSSRCLLTVVHVEVDGEYIRIISARRASASEEAFYDQ